MSEQIPLTLFSLLSIFCLTGKDASPLRKWGPVFGLLSQPFWLFATWKAAQWGMFGLSCIYTVLWVRGIYNGFYRSCHDRI